MHADATPVAVTDDEVALGPAPGRSIRWCDCIVVLASEGFDPLGEGTFPALVRGLARGLPTYVVVPSLEVDDLHVSGTPVEGLSVVHVSTSPDRRRDGRVNQLLCEARRLRPLLLTDDPAWSRYLATRCSALTLLCFTDATIRTLAAMGRDREIEPSLRRVLSRCDLLVAPAPLARHLARRYGCEARVLEAGLLSSPAARAAVRPPAPPDPVADPRARAIAARFRPTSDEPALDWGAYAGPVGDIPAQRVLDEAMAMIASPPPAAAGARLNVLICYDDTETHIATLREYLESYGMFSQHHVSYASGCTSATTPVDLGAFDVVVLHYSVRVSLAAHLSPHLVRALRAFGGLKVLYMQDDYECTENARRWIEHLGLHAVYTCVLRDHHEDVFPLARFPAVEFIRTLTGYVPLRFDRERELVPMAERKVLLGYRGRALPYWYGDLGREKLMIGVRMREICEARGLPVDIEWDDDKRIYGDAWYDFHERVRAVLGSESGSNVFDDDGAIKAAIMAALAERPDLSYEEAHARFVEAREGQIVSAQISPRVFEAVSLGAALVLFRGRYDNIVKPGLHYIPLEKDFSNADEVLRLLQDDDYLTRLTRRAYEDIILSGRYSYRRMVADFDAWLLSRLRHASGQRPVTSTVGFLDPFNGSVTAPHASFSRGYPTNELLCYWSDTYDKNPAAERSAYGALPEGAGRLPDGPPPAEDRPLVDLAAARRALTESVGAPLDLAFDAVVVFGSVETSWYMSLLADVGGPCVRVAASDRLAVRVRGGAVEIDAPPASDEMISELLSDLGIRRPLFVLHDPRFEGFVTSRHSPLRVGLAGGGGVDLVICADDEARAALGSTRAVTLPLQAPVARRLPAEPTFLVPGSLDGTVDLARLGRLPASARLLMCDWPAAGESGLDPRMTPVGPLPAQHVRWYADRVHAAVFAFTDTLPAEAPALAAALESLGVPCAWHAEVPPPPALARCRWVRDPDEVMQLARVEARLHESRVDPSSSRVFAQAVAQALAAAPSSREALRVLEVHEGPSVLGGSRHVVRSAAPARAEHLLSAEGPFDAVMLRAASPPCGLLRRLRALGPFTVLWLDDAERPDPLVARALHLPVHAVATRRDPRSYDVDDRLARLDWLALGRPSVGALDDWLAARVRRVR